MPPEKWSCSLPPDAYLPAAILDAIEKAVADGYRIVDGPRVEVKKTKDGDRLSLTFSVEPMTNRERPALES
jgi:hypothetical protein